MQKIFTILTAVMTLTFAQAQDSFKPHSIGPEINSEYDEIDAVITPDGKTLYFVRINHPENNMGEINTQDIWYSNKQDDGTWTRAKRLNTLFNNSRNNAIVSITNDGLHYIVNGHYTNKNHIWKKRGLSTVQKIDSTFSPPEYLQIPKFKRGNRGNSSNAFMTNEENVIFLAYTHIWQSDNLQLYVTKKNDKGKWTSPKKVSKNIRKEFKSVTAPYLTPDAKTLYFSGYKKGKENKNLYDIYFCERLDDTYRNWTDPVKLGDTVNTQVWDSYFKTYKGGSWAIFTSSRNPAGKSDIFIMKLFEENPFVVVKGVVKNELTGEPFDSDVTFSILVNGEQPDSLNINVETAEYTLVLPLNAKYEIKPYAENYESESIEIDVTGVREYTEKNEDLSLSSYPYVTLSGKFMDLKSNGVIPAEANAKLVVNDQIIDTLSNSDPGSYQINLPWGKAYTLQVLADQYEPQKVRVDLTDIKSFREMSQDLSATPFEKFAILRGKIINKKTGKPITDQFSLEMNDEKNISSKLTQGTGEYYVELPLGKTYTINGSAKKYFPEYIIVDVSKETDKVIIEKDLYMDPIEIGVHITLNNIFFEHNSAILKPVSFHDIDKVAELLADYESMKIEIGGHTDSWGSNKLNQKLSEDRAHSVRDYIISKGIAEDRVTYKGYGEDKPVATNRTEAGRSKNRRVEFTILAN